MLGGGATSLDVGSSGTLFGSGHSSPFTFDSEGQDFLSRIVAVDETWVRSYEPQLKRQSAKWHTQSSARTAKYRRTQSKLKMLMIFPTIDMEFSLVTRSRVVKPLMGNTMRSIFKKKKKKLTHAIRRKRPEFLAAGARMG